MSDSSEDEDLSRFREAVDTSFTKLINDSRNKTLATNEKEKPKSERYLEEASHYNDVKVPEELQRQIGYKLSDVIKRHIKFVDTEPYGVKNGKIKGGVKLFKDSVGFLSAEDPKDTYTAVHNAESRKIKKKRKQIEQDDVNENDKIKVVTVDGEYVLSKEETKHWKSRRKEKVFKYKKNGNILTAVE
ncbi:uncharacterized protein LOC128679176 [Plodia interpunctella]|uniref:uncharacterized protein LOC128679176 n=1 Tax=Plodia interpunctella TaxID=58824 RepID=UPI0023688CF8|nr:uncharacterized protein LOC128679176 [Plodia interpunctella]